VCECDCSPWGGERPGRIGLQSRGGGPQCLETKGHRRSRSGLGRVNAPVVEHLFVEMEQSPFQDAPICPPKNTK